MKNSTTQTALLAMLRPLKKCQKCSDQLPLHAQQRPQPALSENFIRSENRWKLAKLLQCQDVIYVCMYVCMHVCMYVYMHACMHVCMYVCVCVWSDLIEVREMEREREMRRWRRIFLQSTNDWGGQSWSDLNKVRERWRDSERGERRERERERERDFIRKQWVHGGGQERG